MKEFYEFLKKEGILEVASVVFLLTAMCTTGAVMFGQAGMPAEMVASHYARHGALIDWLFILILPLMVSAVVGIWMSLTCRNEG